MRFLLEHAHSGINIKHCPGGLDFSPCICSPDYFRCSGISLNSVAKLFEEKNKTNESEFERLELVIQYLEDLIPAKILNDRRVTNEINLICESITTKLRIDPDAFKASKNMTKTHISIESCDVTGLHFGYLEGFTKLEKLHFGVANIHLANWFSFPRLANLKTFSIQSRTHLSDWKPFPKLEIGLANAILYMSKIDDATIDPILQWIINSPAAKELKQLNVGYNALTEIPLKFSSFNSLQKIDMSFNRLSKTLKCGSFNFSTKAVSNINLRSTGIEIIETGAFQG